MSNYIVIKSSSISKFDTFIPHVIEPSVGIDRIFFAVFSHNLMKRQSDEKRFVLNLSKSLRLYDLAILQLSNEKNIVKYLNETLSKFYDIKYYADDSNTSIGKKYVRADSLGIKYAITIDFDTLKDNTVTIREQLSCLQIRTNIEDIIKYGVDEVWNINHKKLNK